MNEPNDLKQWIKRKEAEYQKTNLRIQKLCFEMNYTHMNDSFFKHRVLVDSRHHLVMCKNDKVKADKYVDIRPGPERIQKLSNFNTHWPLICCSGF